MGAFYVGDQYLRSDIFPNEPVFFFLKVLKTHILFTDKKKGAESIIKLSTESYNKTSHTKLPCENLETREDSRRAILVWLVLVLPSGKHLTLSIFVIFIIIFYSLGLLRLSVLCPSVPSTVGVLSSFWMKNAYSLKKCVRTKKSTLIITEKKRLRVFLMPPRGNFSWLIGGKLSFFCTN